MILVSKCMVHKALSENIYLSLGLLSPLILVIKCEFSVHTVTVFMSCTHVFTIETPFLLFANYKWNLISLLEQIK